MPPLLRRISRKMDRAGVHAACALASLLTGAVWSLSLLFIPGVRLHVARWWSLINLATFAFVLAASLTALRRHPPRRLLDALCTALEVVVLVAWMEAMRPLSESLLALPALIVMIHGISAGPAAGAACAALAGASHAAMLGAGAYGLLPLVLSAPPLSSQTPAAVWIVGVLLAYGVATAMGHLARGQYATPERPASRRPSSPDAGRHSGQVLDGRYRLGSVIGRGGMGEVYAARRLGDGATFAVKILHAHLGESGSALQRFWREAAGVDALPPGRIAPVHDSGSTDGGLHFIVMDLLRGEDLAARLARERRLGLRQTVSMIEQLAEVLDAAAASGIVHRDVKPRNIFLVEHRSRELDVRLLDFGICRVQDGAPGAALSRTAALVGTPGFLAPEQILSGFGEIGPHTDVFALGAVTYRALSGEEAFPSRSPAEAVYEALNHHPPSLVDLGIDVPPEVSAVLALALAKSPAARYGSAGRFASDLRAATEGSLSSTAVERAAALSSQRPREATLTGPV